MSIRYSLAVLAALFAAHSAFAHDTNKSCAAIAKSCLDAGYTLNQGEGKQFWHGCMRPILLNKTMSDVKIDEKDVKECRTAKIVELKKELADLKNAQK